MARYTTEDQEFFFEMANKILDRFGLLNDVDSDSLFDVIEFYSDLLVNALDEFKQWKENCKKMNETGEIPPEMLSVLERVIKHIEKQEEPTTEALSQEC